jgi:hypothetical protein
MQQLVATIILLLLLLLLVLLYDQSCVHARSHW